MVQFWKWRSPVGSTYGSEMKVPLILERQNHRGSTWSRWEQLDWVQSMRSCLLFRFTFFSRLIQHQLMGKTQIWRKHLFTVSYRFSRRGEKLNLTSIAPILNDIEIPLFVLQINGSLFTPKNPSIARQEPGPGIDDAWAYFDLVRTHVITKNDVIKLGKDPKTIARFNNNCWGFGEDAYMAQMDVFYQIHCLNMLRRAAFAGHGTKRPMKHSKIGKIHLGHCTDILSAAKSYVQCEHRNAYIRLDRKSDITISGLQCPPQVQRYQFSDQVERWSWSGYWKIQGYEETGSGLQFSTSRWILWVIWRRAQAYGPPQWSWSSPLDTVGCTRKPTFALGKTWMKWKIIWSWSTSQESTSLVSVGLDSIQSSNNRYIPDFDVFECLQIFCFNWTIIISRFENQNIK